ncbi:MAG: DUF2975 domain-containing protein [Tannerella sp.]|jgi:hypothetical protein|nr:DUF2975 domain-containing protein [Tannerella sp.]
MKKRFNLITFFIGIAVGISLWNTVEKEFADMKASFMEGYKEGMNRASNKPAHFDSFYLALRPTGDSYMPDSIVNMKTGEWVPTRITETYVRVPKAEGLSMDLLWIFPASIILIGGFIMIVFNLVKIILAVNKSIIFDWVNVRRLRRIGIGFVIMFVVNIVISLLHNTLALKSLEFENYDIINSSYDGGILMFGMIAFLVAEIFAVGLRLKEDQDLTI